MDRVVDLTEIVAREIADYVALGAHGEATYFVSNEANHTYAFISVPHDHPQESAIILLARVRDDQKIIIETDLTDKPLYKSLIEAGVPRRQIIRAYADKTGPEP